MTTQPTLVGSIWERKNSTKTSVNAPRIKVLSEAEKSVSVQPTNFFGKYGFVGAAPRTIAKTTLRNEWRQI